jgi:hypothetical protein
MDGCIGGQMDGGVDRQMHGRTSGWVKGRMGSISGWSHPSLHTCPPTPHTSSICRGGIIFSFFFNLLFLLKSPSPSPCL